MIASACSLSWLPSLANSRFARAVLLACAFAHRPCRVSTRSAAEFDAPRQHKQDNNDYCECKDNARQRAPSQISIFITVMRWIAQIKIHKGVHTKRRSLAPASRLAEADGQSCSRYASTCAHFASNVQIYRDSGSSFVCLYPTASYGPPLGPDSVRC